MLGLAQAGGTAKMQHTVVTASQQPRNPPLPFTPSEWLRSHARLVRDAEPRGLEGPRVHLLAYTGAGLRCTYVTSCQRLLSTRQKKKKKIQLLML
jgi:hypothetical protein